MNEWSIAIIGGMVGSMVVFLSPQKPLLLKQILIIGVVGYISLALLLLHYESFLTLLFMLVLTIGFIGKKVLETGRIKNSITLKGGE